MIEEKIIFLFLYHFMTDICYNVRHENRKTIVKIINAENWAASYLPD